MKRKLVLGIHYLIIIHFVVEILYTGFIVFTVLRPEGAGSGPLMGAAASIPHELLVRRRLYAIECWIATGGLAIYLALTSFKPYFSKDTPAQAD